MTQFWLMRRISVRSPRMALLVSVLISGISVLGILATANARKAEVSNLKPQPIELHAQSFNFDSSNPAQRDFGKLKWRGGLIVTAKNPVFGGYSGLSVSPDGRSMLAVSDAGSWLSTDLVYEDGQLAGLKNARIGPITDKKGKPLSRSRDRDAESIFAIERQGPGLEGRYYIGFERFHRLDSYDFKDGELSARIRRGSLPNVLRKMPYNSGLEGAARIRGGPYEGGLVLFAERKLNQHGDHIGAIVHEGKAFTLYLKRSAQFDVTALETLQDGSLLVLERSFIRSELKLDIRLRLIPAAEIAPKALLEGEVLFHADRRYRIDNFEAMGVHTGKDGETVITLMSDDNFNFFQSTLLAQFALPSQ